ncbi:hypothetical protein [Pseudoalteromonas ardens]|uniref:VCBS repeat-containing protein n=1 Tax=Pseudoalteromonas rubra TaxID=43658 RepID=A0A0L0EP42_9GAMM|nr:hypothetical protein [Pseudoalteromonas sp. R96]KNC66140.1 hypothetical protein AC626_18805 [Pseudoalteromonas rubra]MDK1312866.1 hypothetical protein [Pseudoalteromonas sp. R96]
MKTSMLALCSLLASGAVNATTTESFGTTQDLLVNEDVKTLHVVDINADSRKDLVWVTNTGAVKFKLQNNDALASLESLPGTRWRLEYNGRSDVKYIDFTSEGGVLQTHDNKLFNVINVTMSQTGTLDFCTPFYNGLDKTECQWHYSVTEILPNVMKGVDKRLNTTWVAYKLVN